MTQAEFLKLQHELHDSGKPLMRYLQDAGINYSTYTYWRSDRSSSVVVDNVQNVGRRHAVDRLCKFAVIYHNHVQSRGIVEDGGVT